MKNRKCLHNSSVFWVVLLLATSLTVQADITTDGSVGAVQNLSGPNFTVPEILGTRTGNNLFHSFSDFNINSGESATFTGAADISNVVSRVTGSGISTINGLLRSQVGTADFYFINPNGVVFGADAVVDVPAALHVSTADELRFADGNIFNSKLSGASILTMAAPESFGFVSSTAGDITINAMMAILQAGPDAPLTLSGGDISINAANIETDGSRLDISAMGTATGQFAVNAVQGNLVETGQLTLGDSTVTIEKDSTTASLGNASLAFRAGDISLQNSDITVLNSEASDVSSVQLQANGTIALLQGSVVKHETSNLGRSALINVDADTFLMDQRSAFFSVTTSTQDAADLNIQSNDLDVLNGSQLASFSSSSANGGNLNLKTNAIEVTGGQVFTFVFTADANGGDINIETNSISLEETAQLLTFSSGAASGNAGNINLQANDIDVRDKSFIRSRTHSSNGDAGDLNIQAKAIHLQSDGVTITDRSSISTQTFSTRQAGDVNIQADSIFQDGGVIYSTTDGSGNGGNVKIKTSSLEIQGGGQILLRADSSTGDTGNIEIESDTINLENGGLINTQTTQDGDGGAILINAGSINLKDQASIVTNTFLGKGNAGDISIIADTINLSSQNYLMGPSINSQTLGEGNAGNIDIVTGSLVLSDNIIPTSASSQVFIGSVVFGSGNPAVLTGSGNAGSLTIRATDSVLLDGGTISTATVGSGNAGSIDISTPVLTLQTNQNGREAKISSSATDFTSGSGFDGLDVGQAGIINIHDVEQLSISGELTGITVDQFQTNPISSTNTQVNKISIQAENLSVEDKARISASSSNALPAGQIDIDAGRITLSDQGLISTDATGSGSGGDITINMNELIMNNGIFTTSSSGATGDGGNIDITGLGLIMRGGFIQANTEAIGGQGGTININTEYLFAENSALIIGGQKRIPYQTGLNVIQAASPSGIQGEINISASPDNSSQKITPPDNQLVQLHPLIDSVCNSSEKVSSLVNRTQKQPMPTSPRHRLLMKTVMPYTNTYPDEFNLKNTDSNVWEGSLAKDKKSCMPTH